MTRIVEALHNDFTNALGWTLLHSLWQGLSVLLLVVVIMRLVPVMRSGLRYSIACAALMLLAGVSAATFLNLLGEPVATDRYLTHNDATLLIITAQPSAASHGVVPFITGAIQPNIPLIVALWAVGFLFFAMRISNLMLYTRKIRRTAVPLSNEWSEFLSRAVDKLRIPARVRLAESSYVNAPVVMGYFKPVILIPLGMSSGLTTEQIETIFLHELAHIKRHDYLVNFLQSIIETFFFFNPFVWLLSNIIRREREYCCDDLVIHLHGGRKAYTHALVRLAESQLRSSGFALALAHDKNQLLDRIKRIMKDSARSHSSKSKFFILVTLLLGAVLCISWLGTDADSPRANVTSSEERADTIPDTSENTARYSRKSIITIDENGQPHEQVIEEFEGDESLRSMLQQRFKAIPDIAVPPALPDVAIDPIPGLVLPAPIDTFPPFGSRDQRSWEDLARTLEEQVRRRFEALEHFQRGDSSNFMRHFREQFVWPPFDSMNVPMPFRDSFGDLGLSYENLRESLDELRALNMERFDHLRRQFNDLTIGTDRYEDVLRDELVKDGYLSEDETIESLEWNSESFKVNGKNIKKSDLEKYKRINEEHLGGRLKPGKLE